MENLFPEIPAESAGLLTLTRISPETYRAIAPAVKDGALHVDGEAIELNAENSRKVAAAVSRLRRAIPGRTASRETRSRISAGAR